MKGEKSRRRQNNDEMMTEKKMDFVVSEEYIFLLVSGKWMDAEGPEKYGSLVNIIR